MISAPPFAPEHGPEVPGELLSVPGSRTGVIVAMSDKLSAKQADDLRAQFEERFPGVTFAVVCGASALVSFEFDELEP